MVWDQALTEQNGHRPFKKGLFLSFRFVASPPRCQKAGRIDGTRRPHLDGLGESFHTSKVLTLSLLSFQFRSTRRFFFSINIQ